MDQPVDVEPSHKETLNLLRLKKQNRHLKIFLSISLLTTVICFSLLLYIWQIQRISINNQVVEQAKFDNYTELTPTYTLHNTNLSQLEQNDGEYIERITGHIYVEPKYSTGKLYIHGITFTPLTPPFNNAGETFSPCSTGFIENYTENEKGEIIFEYEMDFIPFCGLVVGEEASINITLNLVDEVEKINLGIENPPQGYISKQIYLNNTTINNVDIKVEVK